MTEEEEKNRRAIVPSVGVELTKPGSGLIRRGLSDLSQLKPEQVVVPASPKTRILVCDDQEALVEVITGMLVSTGYEVRSTLNSLEAIDIAREFQPDVALIGEIMPRMDGFKLAPKLASFLPQTKIVLTGEAEPSDLERFRERGWPFDILLLPLIKEEFLEKTRKWALEAHLYDLVTGLYNAHHFGFILDTEIVRSERYGYAFSIILCKFRPSWNLQADDDSTWKKNRLLRKIADQVKSVCRLIDFAFYLLDNEFALLLPQTTRASTVRVTELLRKMFQESGWKDESGIAVKLDATVSLASFPEDGRTKPELLARLFQ